MIRRGGEVQSRMKSSFLEKLLLWYFPVEMMYRFLLLRDIDTHMILLLQAFILVYGAIAFLRTKYNGSFKTFVCFYLVYSILSIVFVVSDSRLIAGYINDLRVVLLPILAVFIGMYSKNEKIYKVFIYTVVVCMTIGLYLYFVKPAWYIQHLVEYWNDQWYSTSTATEDNIMSGTYLWASRFSAIFTTPYAVSYFGTFALCLLTVDIYKTEDKRLIKNRVLQLLFFSVLAISAVLCQNRVAIVYLACLLLWGLYYGTKNHRKEKNIFICAFAGTALIIAVAVIYLAQDEFMAVIIDTLTERFTDTQENGLHNVSRDSQVSLVFNSWNNIPFGEGLGTKGGVARRLGLPGVTDNGYIKLMVEQGILGLLLVVTLFLASAKRAYKYRKYLMSELLIIGYVLFTMIGANTLGMEFDYMIIMWYAVGRIWNSKYLKGIIESNNRI